MTGEQGVKLEYKCAACSLNELIVRFDECDKCGAITDDCKETKDFDEGLFGDLHVWCYECRRKQNKQFQTELDESEVFG